MSLASGLPVRLPSTGGSESQGTGQLGLLLVYPRIKKRDPLCHCSAATFRNPFRELPFSSPGTLRLCGWFVCHYKQHFLFLPDCCAEQLLFLTFIPFPFRSGNMVKHIPQSLYTFIYFLVLLWAPFTNILKTSSYICDCFKMLLRKVVKK